MIAILVARQGHFYVMKKAFGSSTDSEKFTVCASQTLFLTNFLTQLTPITKILKQNVFKCLKEKSSISEFLPDNFSVKLRGFCTLSK